MKMSNLLLSNTVQICQKGTQEEENMLGRYAQAINSTSKDLGSVTW